MPVATRMVMWQKETVGTERVKGSSFHAQVRGSRLPLYMCVSGDSCNARARTHTPAHRLDRLGWPAHARAVRSFAPREAPEAPEPHPGGGFFWNLCSYESTTNYYKTRFSPEEFQRGPWAPRDSRDRNERLLEPATAARTAARLALGALWAPGRRRSLVPWMDAVLEPSGGLGSDCANESQVPLPAFQGHAEVLERAT